MQFCFIFLFCSKNILHLLGKREVSPRTKYVPKKQWGEAPKRNVCSSPWTEPIRDARRGILSWYLTLQLYLFYFYFSFLVQG